MNLHIVLYSSFPHTSGGRENWTYHIVRHLEGRFDRVFIYSVTSDLPIYYDLEAVPWIELIQVSTVRNWVKWRNNLSSRIVHKFLTLLDLHFVFPKQVAEEMATRIEGTDIVLALNSIVELAAARRLRRSVATKFRIYCSVRGLVAQEFATTARFPGSYYLYQRLERKSLKRADIILANGFDTQRYLRSQGFESTIIPNGVSIRQFAEPNVRDFSLESLKQLRKNGAKIVSVIGSLRAIKGINEALQAVPILKQLTDKNFMVVFVGNGDPRTFKETAIQLNFEQNVLFFGESNNVPGILALTDVAACVSYGSGFSMAALECMASSRPIVAWDSGVYRQMLTHDVSAILVDERDPKKLAEAVAYLFDSPEKAASLGNGAFRASKDYDWDNIAESLMDAFTINEYHH